MVRVGTSIVKRTKVLIIPAVKNIFANLVIFIIGKQSKKSSSALFLDFVNIKSSYICFGRLNAG